MLHLRRMLGPLLLMILLCDAESGCNPEVNPLTLDPPEVIGEYGNSMFVNCTSSEEFHDEMYWEIGGALSDREEEKNFLSTTLVFSDWNLKAKCQVTVNETFKCSKDLNIVIYKTPDVMSISVLDDGPMEEGREYLLNCDIVNVAPVQNLIVKWYRGNETVQEQNFTDTRVTPVNVSSALRVRAERGACFRCEAELHLGPKGPELIPTATSLPYTAAVLYKPLILRCPDHYVGVEHNFTLDMLPFQAEGNPPPIVQWYYQGELINASEPLTRSHSGKYTAEVMNSLGRSNTSVNIIIEYKPLILRCPDHYAGVEHNFTLDMLPFQAEGNPPPIVQWYYQGELINASEPLTRSHSGKYTAEVMNSLGRSNTSVNITIEYAPELKNTSDVSVYEGDNVSLSCEADANPPPVFSWTQDGVKILENTNNFSIAQVLTSTTYECTAYNYLGSTTKQILVNVIKTNRIAIPAAMTTPEASTQTGCPLILKPAEVVVRFGDPVSVNCSTSATDALGMGWEATHGGREYEEVSALTWTVDRLTEWVMEPTCYVNLRDSQCSEMPNITLYKTPDVMSISVLDDGPMEEGREYLLNCDIVNVAPVQNLIVKWYRGHKTVQEQMFMDTSVTPVNVSSALRVRAERGHDGAHFRCEAELHLGPKGPELIPTATSLSYTAAVLYAPVFRMENYNKELNPGENVTFECSAEGNPPPEVRWHYTPAVNVMETPGGRQKNISITLATSTNVGVYVCVATNKVGHVTRSVTLMMTGKTTAVPSVVFWGLAVLLMIIIIFSLILFCRNCSKKHGQYSFIPDKANEGSDRTIPMTTKADGVQTSDITS